MVSETSTMESRLKETISILNIIYLFIVLLSRLSFLEIASTEAQTVNLMLFSEETNSIKGFDAAVDFVRNTPSLSVRVGTVQKQLFVNTGGTDLLKRICQNIHDAFEDAEKPDIVVDFTRRGNHSNAVKMIVKEMNLPTIAGSFGQEGDTWSWSDLTGNMKNYLIQVSPPADMIPQAVRSLVLKKDMKNAAILYDDDYEMKHKQKSLFKDMKTRSIFQKLNHSAVKETLEDLARHKFSNIFILLPPNVISNVLEEISAPEIQKKFGSGQALYSMSLELGIPHCGRCRSNVKLIHLSPIFPTTGNKRWDYLKTKGKFEREKLTDMFYFDLTADAILTVARMEKDGTWRTRVPPNTKCDEPVKYRDDSNVPHLYDCFKKKRFSKHNLLGPFHMDSGKTVGKSYAQFEMNIQRLSYKANQEEPESVSTLGTWTAGFGGMELIHSKGHEDEWKAHG